MDAILELTVRCIGYVLLDVVFGTLLYCLGWPVVPLISLGRYSRQPWPLESHETVFVSCIGLAIALLGMMATLGQFYDVGVGI
jgi:hypothetical protein